MTHAFDVPLFTVTFIAAWPVAYAMLWIRDRLR